MKWSDCEFKYLIILDLFTLLKLQNIDTIDNSIILEKRIINHSVLN